MRVDVLEDRSEHFTGKMMNGHGWSEKKEMKYVEGLSKIGASGHALPRPHDKKLFVFFPWQSHLDVIHNTIK